MDKSARAILAENLNKALEGAKLSRRAWAAQLKLDLKAVERAQKEAVGTSVDQLDVIAKALKMKPWQLLHPNPQQAALALLSPEVAEIALQLESTKGEERERKLTACWSIAFSELRPKQQPEQGGEEAGPTRKRTGR